MIAQTFQIEQKIAPPIAAAGLLGPDLVCPECCLDDFGGLKNGFHSKFWLRLGVWIALQKQSAQSPVSKYVYSAC